MKFIKKIFVVLFVAFAFLVVAGCNEKEVNLYDEFISIVDSIENKDALVSDINLPTSKGEIQITWTSSKPEVISASGVVTRQKEDVQVSLTAILKYGEVTENFYFDVVVKAKELTEDDTDKISDIISSDESKEYFIKGIVVGVNAQSFLVADNTGKILVYRGYDYAKDLVIGDIVTVKGTTTTYGGAKQFDKTSEYKKVGFEDIEGKLAITPLTVEEINAYADATEISPLLVAIKGKVSTSSSSDGTKTYYNLEITGANIKGSITYPVDPDSVTALSGKNVEVIGFVTGVTGSSTKYLNLMVVSIKEVEVENVPAEEKPIAQIVASEVGLYTTTGVVAAVNAQSFVLADGDAAILVYLGKTWECDVVVGDKLTVTGNTTVYAKAVQFDKTCQYQKTGTETFTLPSATELDGAKITEIGSQEVATLQFVKVTGKLAVSGKYYNVTFNGTDLIGSVTYPSDADAVKALNGKDVIIEGYYTGLASDIYFNLMVTSIVEKEVEVEPAVEKTVSEVLDSETDKSYIVTGTVVAINAQSFIITDGNASMLVYKGKDWTADVVVGDKVKVTGVTTVYSKAVQFGKDATYEKVGTEEVAAPTATVFDGAKVNEAAALEKVTIQYIKIEGVLSVSGNYYNVAFNGTTVQGSITYPIDTESLAEYNGKGITIEGYFTGVTVSSSAGKTFFNILGVNYSASDYVIETPEPDPNPNPTDGVVYDFVTNFATYASGWDTSYKERVVNSSDLGTGLPNAKFIFSRADKQNAGQSIDDRPVIAAGKSNENLSVYLTVEADFTGFSTISFDLKQWGTKTFTAIQIEYTTDGTNWVKCSESITTPGLLTSNASFEGATKIRICVTTNNTKSNVQLGLTSITLGK